MLETTSDNAFRQIVAGLRGIGYYDTLLQEDYRFGDWFTPGVEERRVEVAAFGQTPVAYDSACIGVVRANGLHHAALIDQFRALGAPVILEIDKDEIREWAVSRNVGAHALVGSYPFDGIDQMFANSAQEWKPAGLLRAKNIGSFHGNPQLNLFAGLLPELEHHIQAKLEPLLHETLTITRDIYRARAGREPDPSALFKLVFWTLTAKVFRDRGVPRFALLGEDTDELLQTVARQYKEPLPRLLNREARQAAASHIWTSFDFRNLSVEVLSQMWSTMLVDATTRKRLGIHRTSRTLVRYIIERIPFLQSGDDKRIIFEPCSGSAVFLIGAMNALRTSLYGMTPQERHAYFVKHLVGMEADPFGVEISRLALTLADFPNPGGWTIDEADVFEPGIMTSRLQQAGVVLCNPPYSTFDQDEKLEYGARSPLKPVELVNRVLNDLHPLGVLGFVLPRNIVDGQSYVDIRKRLIQRFASVDLTILPDKAFDADTEVGLLVATEPIRHNACRLVNSKVSDSDASWKRFELRHEVSATHAVNIGIHEDKPTFAVPELPEVWDFLVNFPKLEEVAELHRGIEWNRALKVGGVETGHRRSLVREEPSSGFRLGVAPMTKFNVFQIPDLKYLSLRPEDERKGFGRDWGKPKAILNKAARARGAWRLAAFPDTQGSTFYQTFIGVWPTSDRYDEWLLSAVLNSPVANAFVSTREGKTDVTIETLRMIPMPHFTPSQKGKLRSLIERYQEIDSYPLLMAGEAERVLMEIDAAVLDGYKMPPRLERQVLDYFRGHHDRPTAHKFTEYIPADHEVYFSLSDYLAPEFKDATVGELLKRTRIS